MYGGHEINSIYVSHDAHNLCKEWCFGSFHIWLGRIFGESFFSAAVFLGIFQHPMSEYITGECSNKYQIMNTPRELLRYLSNKIREELVENRAIGHSFIDIKNASYANVFIGHYKHTLNDSIATWIVKARCNILFTGSLALKSHVPAESIPCCPYYGTNGDDTLSHRINRCKSSMVEQTKRHNNIQNIVLEYMKIMLGENRRYKTNSTLNRLGIQLNKKEASLKPDIIAWNETSLWIVESSCVYANTGKDGNKLEFTYNQKVNKYADLVKSCKEKSIITS